MVSQLNQYLILRFEFHELPHSQLQLIQTLPTFALHQFSLQLARTVNQSLNLTVPLLGLVQELHSQSFQLFLGLEVGSIGFLHVGVESRQSSFVLFHALSQLRLLLVEVVLYFQVVDLESRFELV